MPLYTVAYACINSPSFLGGSERLRSPLMFHLDPQWQARLVKRKWPTEGRGRFAHDKMVARYIWGVDGAGKCFSEFDKKSRYGGYGLLFSGDKNLL